MKNLLKALFLFVALFAFTQGVWAETFITDVMVIAGDQSQTDGYKTQLQNQGWTVIDNDLNAGAGGNFIYLLYKTNESSGSSRTAVTGFYLKTGNSNHPNILTYDGHTYNLASAVGSNDLNCGAGGAYIFLYYTKEAFSPGRRVTDIYFNNNSNGALGANGNTSSGFDLNSGAGGDYIYMHVVTITTDDIIDVYTEAQLRNAVMLNDANIRLMADINITSEVEINNNLTVTLDLNGHTLDRGLSSSTNYGHVLKVFSGSTLTINDASGDNSGIIKGAYTGQGGGISNYGTIIINGGTIRDNHSSAKGGGINNHNGALLTINGGVITNNEAQDGAGIYNEATGTITINNCSIIGNTTNKYGGGGITNYGILAIYSGTVSNNTAIMDGGGIWNDNSLTVSGVAIEGNSALNGGGICINHGTADLTNVTISGNTSKDGGGIYVYSVGTLTFNSGSISDNTTTEYGGGGIANHGNTTIFSGSITDNTSVENGGGIWTGNTLTLKGGTITNNHAGSNTHGDGVYYYGGTFNLEGNPQIYGNLKADGQLGINVYLPSGKMFTVTGAFTEEANVFVTMESPGVFTTGFKSNDSITNAFEVFLPDNIGYYVTEENGEARLTALGNRVAYIQRLWDPSTHKITAQMMTCSDFVRLEGSSSNSSTELGSGWYVVDRNVSYKSRLKIVGYDVNIILCDGATLNANGGIFIQDDMRLTVFGQSIGSGKIKAHPDSGPGIGGGYNTAAGHFVVKGGTIDAEAGSEYNAGIGGGNGGGSGIRTISIYGGTVTAQGGKSGAGIGKGRANSERETITIYGGVITARGGEYAAGIGGGENRTNGNIEIWNGKVKAYGGNEAAGIGGGKNGNQRNPITIHGGYVYADGSWDGTGSHAGAGIGGGDHGDGGEVTINGGTVKAYGGRMSAGIGGGGFGACGNITINDGEVTASASYDPGRGAGIGSGSERSQGGTITINGGIVTAKSKVGAGIGGGYEGNSAIINITDGLVQASSKEGAGIGGGGGPGGGGGGNGGTTNISGGVVIAFSKQKGAGIGGGNDGDGGTVNISGGHVTAVGGNYDFDYWREHHEPNYLSFIKNFGGRDYHSSVLYFIANLIFSGSYGGAGIGGGDDGDGANVTITGGTVIASAANAYAIGRGDGGGTFGILNLYQESMVQTKEGGNWVLQNVADRIHKVQHGTYAVIEPCPHESVTYLIDNEDNHTVQCNYCGHVHAEPHVINSSTGQCICGFGVTTHTVTVYQASENGNGAYASGVSNTVAHGFDFMLPSNAVNPENFEFVGWMVGTPSQVNGYEVTGGETLYAEGEAYNVTDNVAFIARYKNYWNGTGSGAGNDPFLIATTDDLIQLSNRVNAGEDYEGRYFLLVNDLVFDGTANNFTAIGNNTHRFNGTFDGNHHSISGININKSQNFQGLFGVVGQNGTVKGVTLQDCTIKGDAYSGSIVGGNDGTVERCLVLGSTVQGTESGGVVGYTNGNLRFNYYTGNNTTGIGFDNHNSNVDNILGGNKGYTINCAEGLTMDYVIGSTTGSDENAIIERYGTYYTAEGVTISMVVDSPLGYTISSIMVNSTTILPSVEGTYIFTMPAANVNITSTLVQPTFIHEGLWDDEENWSNGLPQGGCDVVIAAPAIIKGVAHVGHITFENGGSITIAKGGELTHSDNVTATFQKGIIAYIVDSCGWFTIASPVTYNLLISNYVATESTYDLYLYHEPTHYWWNSKDPRHQNPEQDFTVLKHREGYLYANSEDVTLSFEGNMLATDNMVTIPLSCYANGSLKGYNLVGNPFTRRLTAEDVIKIGDDDLTTYLMADGGVELVPYTLVERPIEPGEGFFVQATEPGQSLVINSATRGEQAKQEPAYLCIEAGRDGAYGRAYVQMNNGNTLRKIKLSDNTPSVSVWHNGEDWAAATLESATGELPVNFKAAENGTYTISVSIEGLEVEYLHLIDNMTGADTDLLQTPSYSFDAKTTYYDSRFKLVFNTSEADGPSTGSGTFAFVNNGEIIVDGEGLLQVIDMTGRIIISRDGVHTVSTNGMTPGVYVLRLINGEIIKTQKIVIQ
jgi:hypothetical protein